MGAAPSGMSLLGVGSSAKSGLVSSCCDWECLAFGVLRMKTAGKSSGLACLSFFLKADKQEEDFIAGKPPFQILLQVN